MKKILLIILLLTIVPLILAHEGEEESIDLNETIHDSQLNLVYIASIIIGIATIISIHYEKKLKKSKKYLFLLIIIPAILVTLFLASSTIYLNVISETKGPVHWHADFEIWNCGEKIDLVNPGGLSNRVGSSVFHEHGDDRIHVEGVVVDKIGIDLHNFFKVLGGTITKDTLLIPTDNDFLNLKNNDLCNNKPGELQAFIYKVNNPKDTKNWKFTQEKIENFPDLVLSPYSNIPPGDCIIIEFDSEIKEKTNKICETYKIAIEKGDLIGS